MELRFNPMKRNRNGEQDLDHIIAAAIRGADRAALEYPVKPGIILILDREFSVRQNEIIVEKAIAWASRGIVGIDIAGRESGSFKVADYKRMFRAARKAGLGITVHTGESGPVSEMLDVVRQLDPDRIGHGVKAAQDSKTMRELAARKIVLEICPTSNLMTKVVADWEEFRQIFARLREAKVRYAIGTDGPEMLQTYIRDELSALGRHGILSVEEQQIAAATSIRASFVDGAAAVAVPRSAGAAPRVSRDEG
jgi:adenosine deaminase